LGKIRIVNELKFRNIGQYNINLALKEISNEEYLDTFDKIAHGIGTASKKLIFKKRERNSVITYSEKGLKAT
jgi:regulatory protein